MNDLSRAVPVVCGIILSGGRILITRRGPEMSRPLKWEFPGGKLEPGESSEECLSRELAEELGITVRVIGRLKEHTHEYDDLRITLIPLVAEYVSGSITLHEHTKYSWVTPEQLPDFDWTPADVPVMQEFMKAANTYMIQGGF